jgi:hypothetical protein
MIHNPQVVLRIALAGVGQWAILRYRRTVITVLERRKCGAGVGSDHDRMCEQQSYYSVDSHR